MRAGNGCDSHVLFDTLKTEYFKRERAKRNLQRLMATFLLSATISIPFLLSYYIDEYYLSSDNILSDDMLDDTVIYGIGKHSVVTKSTKEELTNTVNNIPSGYDLEKIEELENNEYDVYFINNTKVVVTKDNQFGIEIEEAKVKTK